MTIQQIKKKIDVARQFGRAILSNEKECSTYELFFDQDRSEFSLSYYDGSYPHTIICTRNTNDIINLLRA